MKKISVIRFKPKAGRHDDFVNAMSDFMDGKSHPGLHQQFIGVMGDEVISVVVRDSNYIQENAAEGVKWLNTVRHMLEEYNERDLHTIPMTADIVKEI